MTLSWVAVAPAGPAGRRFVPQAKRLAVLLAIGVASVLMWRLAMGVGLLGPRLALGLALIILAGGVMYVRLRSVVRGAPTLGAQLATIVAMVVYAASALVLVPLDGLLLCSALLLSIQLGLLLATGSVLRETSK